MSLMYQFFLEHGVCSRRNFDNITTSKGCF